MKTIRKFILLPLLLVAISCSTETVIDSTEDLNAVTLKGNRKGNCDVFKERPSRNSYVGIGSEFSGTWGYPVGEYTGESFSVVFTDNGDGTITQTSNEVVTTEGGDLLYTSSEALIVPISATEGTYTSTFEVTGGTGRFEDASGSFIVKNGVYDETGAYHNAIGKITSLGLCND